MTQENRLAITPGDSAAAPSRQATTLDEGTIAATPDAVKPVPVLVRVQRVIRHEPGAPRQAMLMPEPSGARGAPRQVAPGTARRTKPDPLVTSIRLDLIDVDPRDLEHVRLCLAGVTASYHRALHLERQIAETQQSLGARFSRLQSLRRYTTLPRPTEDLLMIELEGRLRGLQREREKLSQLHRTLIELGINGYETEHAYD